MKKGFLKLAVLAGFIFLGTVTVEAMEMAMPSCDEVLEGEACSLIPAEELEKFEQENLLAASNPEAAAPEQGQAVQLPSSPDAPGETVTLIVALPKAEAKPTPTQPYDITSWALPTRRPTS